MIEMLNIDDIDQTNTFKLCFDGKQINAGVDVDQLANLHSDTLRDLAPLP